VGRNAGRIGMRREANASDGCYEKKAHRWRAGYSNAPERNGASEEEGQRATIAVGTTRLELQA